MAGMSGMDMLDCRDSFRLLVMQALARKTTALQEQRDLDMATKIANAVAKMLSKV